MATSQNDRWRKEQREEKKTDPGPFGVQMKRNRLRDWKHTVALGGGSRVGGEPTTCRSPVQDPSKVKQSEDLTR